MREVEDAIVQLTPPNFKRNLLINYGHLLCEIMVIYYLTLLILLLYVAICLSREVEQPSC